MNNAQKLGAMFRPSLPEDFKLPFHYTNEPELHNYPSLAIKTADFDGEGKGFRIAVCMDLVPESVAAYIVNACNNYDALVARLAMAQQFMMEVACQPEDRLTHGLRNALRQSALDSQAVLRAATQSDLEGAR